MASLRLKQNRQPRRDPVKAPLSRLSLYERSIQQRAAKQERVRELREIMMEECTFTPNTAKSNSSSRTATTNASSGGESVFDRLYRSGCSSNHSTPLKSNKRPLKPRLSPSSTTGRSALSRTSTAASTRVEELYAAGVRKARARPRSDRAEREWRERRREAKELSVCTFQPNLFWGRTYAPKRKQSSAQHRLEPTMIVNKPVKSKGRQRKAALPVEIIIKTDMSMAQRPWQSPLRPKKLGSAIELMLVSPLRDPSTIATEDDIIELPTSRHHALGPVESATLSQGNETEYGSI